MMTLTTETMKSPPRNARENSITCENSGINTNFSNKAEAQSAQACDSEDAAIALPTPTLNAKLKNQIGGFSTLTEALDYAASGETGYNFFSVKAELKETLPYSVLRDRAINLAKKLSARYPRGSRACLIAETSSEFLTTFFACQYAGIIPAPMPVPVNLGGKDGYIRQVYQMMQGADATVAIGPQSLMEFLEEAASNFQQIDLLSYEALKELPQNDTKLVPFSPEENCYIQYSSGSTSAPKGVIGSQRSVTNNLLSIGRDGLQLCPEDRATCWLPLYHDMGLIGFVLTPLFAQLSVDYLATSDFVRRPLAWIKLITLYGTTITYSPSFGYELAAKRGIKADHSHLDLSKLRIAGIGGDMVRPEALDSFSQTFSDVGFESKAFTPSYGMAEATLAIAFSQIERPVEIDHVDMGHYNRSGIAQPVSAITAPDQKRAFVKCGQALPGHALEVRNSDGSVTADRVVGRIFISGPSITPGYYSDPEASAAMFHGEWLDTGDMGYTLDGDVIITGRAKDLIIINGRNIWPQDIEWAVEEIENVRQGGVAAFSIDSSVGEQVVTIVERRGGLDEQASDALHREIVKTIQASVGALAKVILVRPHSLVMTSSGKLSRSKVREKYLNGEFDKPVETEQDQKAVKTLANSHG